MTYFSHVNHDKYHKQPHDLSPGAESRGGKQGPGPLQRKNMMTDFVG